MKKSNIDFNTYVVELLENINDKLDRVVEKTTRHDEKIKYTESAIKYIIGFGISVFLLIIGATITLIIK